MLLPKFDFHEPKTVAEACQIMAEFGKKAKPLAGGTDLMVNMKHQIVTPEHIVSLGRLDELKAVDSNGMITIGALFTVAEIAQCGNLGKKLSALCAGAKALGSPLIRNLATIGGNLGSARPAADLPPSLMAYGAKVILQNSKGKRELELEKFFVGPGLTAIAPDEILTQIVVPKQPDNSGAGYINLGVRKAQDCNIVNVASFIALDGGVIKTARIVMGCVGPKHLRSPSAEKILIGQKPAEALFEKAGNAAMGDATPITDFRGTAEYKKAMVGELTKRTLAIALKEATAR